MTRKSNAAKKKMAEEEVPSTLPALPELSETQTSLEEMPSLNSTSPHDAGDDKIIALDKIHDVPVKISAVLGKKKIDIGTLMSLEKGAVLNIDRKVGEPIDLYINDTLFARGELVMTDGTLGVSMTEILHDDALPLNPIHKNL